MCLFQGYICTQVYLAYETTEFFPFRSFFREVGLFLLSFNLKTQLDLVKSIIILVNVGQTLLCLFLSRVLEEDLILQHSEVGRTTLPILFQKSKLIVPWG